MRRVRAIRVPLTGSALKLAGQPSRVGSIFAARVRMDRHRPRALVRARHRRDRASPLSGRASSGSQSGTPLALLSLVIGGLLPPRREAPRSKGASAEKDARPQAVFALAAHKGGTLTAQDASAALDMPLVAAEELLSRSPRSEYERVAVDVDANGTLVYRFVRPDPRRRRAYGSTRRSRARRIARSGNGCEADEAAEQAPSAPLARNR